MNNLTKKQRITLTLAILGFGILIDQFTKFLFQALNAMDKLPMYIFSDVGFVYIENAGGAWGMLSGQNVVFFIITVVGIPLFFLLLYIARMRSLIGYIGYSMIISGTLGNAIDRLCRGATFYSGKVRDFISIGSWFPYFNVADMLLVFGCILVILGILYFDHDSVIKSIKIEKEAKLKAEESKAKEDVAE